MDWFLPRGYILSVNSKIIKKIADGFSWQLFSATFNKYVLVVEPVLFREWSKNQDNLPNLFSRTPDNEYFYLVSNGDYLISSVEHGPFPSNYGQVEAFSISFDLFLAQHEKCQLVNAVYIEEYSLILPGLNSEDDVDSACIYSRWLTGGVCISQNDFVRLPQIMTWLPRDRIASAVRSAGFVFPEYSDEKHLTAAQKVDVAVPKDTKQPIGHFSLIGRIELEIFFRENIIDVVLNKEKYKKMGIDFPGATILYGPPGCGKTFAVNKLAEYLQWPRFDIDSSTISSPYIHDTSKKISEVFRQAIDAAPSILVIDEMEAFLSDRGMSGSSGLHHVEEVAEFLRRIPEAISNEVLIFAMTNMIESIDPAILRRGRFDHIIEVKMASAEEISAYLKERFSELPIDSTVSIDRIAQSLAGHPMSDVTFVIREAGKTAVKQDSDVITEECFSKALQSIPSKKERTKIGFNYE